MAACAQTRPPLGAKLAKKDAHISVQHPIAVRSTPTDPLYAGRAFGHTSYASFVDICGQWRSGPGRLICMPCQWIFPNNGVPDRVDAQLVDAHAMTVLVDNRLDRQKSCDKGPDYSSI